MQFQRKILHNGLRILTIPMPSLQSATVLVMVGAGSRYETNKNTGISHFLEHMAFKGTIKRPDAMSISSIIDGMGGEFNAFTGKEITGYYIKSSVDKVELSLDVLSDMLMHSKLDAAEIEKEKGVILEEKNLYEDTPSRKIGDIYEQLLYGDTPMGWDIVGTEAVIKGLTRKDFVEYMESLYSPHNMTVVVAGGINSAQIESSVDKYFSSMNRFDINRFNRVIEKQSTPQLMIRTKKTEQVHIALGFRTVPNEHPDKYALEILAAILGGGMSSRLFHEVREKRGLGYYVRTSSDHYLDCGTLVTTAGIDPKRIDEAIKVIINEYKYIKEGTKIVSDEEFTKAKEFIKGHFVLELEDSRSVASFFAHAEILEKAIETPSDIISKIESVDLDQIMKVARKYITEATINLAVVGNFTNGHRFEKLLKL